MKIINLGEADRLPPVDWAAVADKLESGSAPASDAMSSRTTWLCTVNEDGSPYVTAVDAVWLDGAFWFQTGAGTRKGRNVAQDRRSSIAVSIEDADVVVEGGAARVTEPSSVARVARAWGTSAGRQDQTTAVRASRPRSMHRRKVHRRGVTNDAPFASRRKGHAPRPHRV